MSTVFFMKYQLDTCIESAEARRTARYGCIDAFIWSVVACVPDPEFMSLPTATITLEAADPLCRTEAGFADTDSAVKTPCLEFGESECHCAAPMNAPEKRNKETIYE